MTNDPLRDERTADDSEDEQTTGGLGHSLGGVDLEHAEQVGADPPGGLGLDIGGGTQGLGVRESEDEAADQDEL